MDFIHDNFHKVLDQIQTSAIHSGRKLENINLVVVTKGQSAEKIVQVIQAGARVLGENYPEETDKKIPLISPLPESVEWHMIGHLQSRKTKLVGKNFSMIHSIDRVEIAEDLERKLNFPMRALLEVNLSGEETKGGFRVWNKQTWPEFVHIINRLSEMKQIDVVGLMTMPPYTENPEDSRPVFRKCRELLQFVQNETGNTRFRELSMGTSIDFTVGIEEGATYLRIGEAIMGARNYSK